MLMRTSPQSRVESSTAPDPAKDSTRTGDNPAPASSRQTGVATRDNYTPMKWVSSSGQNGGQLSLSLGDPVAGSPVVLYVWVPSDWGYGTVSPRPTADTAFQLGTDAAYGQSLGGHVLYGFDVHDSQVAGQAQVTPDGHLTVTFDSHDHWSQAGGATVCRLDVTGYFSDQPPCVASMSASPERTQFKVNNDGTFPPQAVTFTVSPAGVPVQWSGDLGANPQIDGNVVRTQYTSLGKHTVSASVGSCSASATAEITAAPTAHIEGYLQSYDDPQHPQSENLAGPAPFETFGGSQETTADRLKLICRYDLPASGAKPLKYTWSASGGGSSDFQPLAASGTAETWQLGTTYLPARPADLQVTCAIDWSDGTKSTTNPQEVVVGIRTDEAVVIGWINPWGVPLSAHGVGRDLLRVFPVNHHWLTSALQGVVAGTYLVRLATGSVTRPNGQGTLTEAERQYVLDWLFRYADNSSAPPSAFADSDALEAFVRAGTGYKLCNHAQIKYHLDQGGMVVD